MQELVLSDYFKKGIISEEHNYASYLRCQQDFDNEDDQEYSLTVDGWKDLWTIIQDFQGW